MNDVYCNYCGDTEFLWGEEKNGICPICYEENTNELSLKVIIEKITELKEKAEYRSNLITENGRDITDIDRAQSKGYASAYGFCLSMLTIFETQNA